LRKSITQRIRLFLAAFVMSYILIDADLVLEREPLVGSKIKPRIAPVFSEDGDPRSRFPAAANIEYYSFEKSQILPRSYYLPARKTW